MVTGSLQEATRKSAVSQETREDGFQGNTVPYTHVEDHTQHVSAEDTQVLVCFHLSTLSFVLAWFFLSYNS